MPLTKLDTTTALIVIDLQKVMLGLPTVHPVGEVVNHAGALTDAFRCHRLPVVLVNADSGAPGRTGTALSECMNFLPDGPICSQELNQQPEDHIVTKQTWGAFTNTDLDEYLKKQGVTQVVIVGIATSFGVESTARHAFELGFNVTLAVDAMTDRNADAHTNSISRIFPRLGETGTTRQVIDLLDARAEKASDWR